MSSEGHLYAHTPAKPGGPWHSLIDHSESVSRMAAEFGSAFGASEFCGSLGLFHDPGKANVNFQSYLRACADGKKPGVIVPHAAIGAALCEANPLAGLAVLGHHAGLASPEHLKESIANIDPQALAAARLFVQGYQPFAPLDEMQFKSNLQAELWLRMAFSALVDADRLDTEAHFEPAKGGSRGGYPDLETYRRNLDRYLLGLASEAPPTPVNQVRADVLKACQAAALSPPGAFRLTVPTGGGKTLSAMSFALGHSIHNGIRRVIVAIPYTSIIEQTADVYREAFMGAEILEHHSAVFSEVDSEDQREQETRRRLAAENWDAPIVVTTTLQLFESLLANRTSPCQKLHRVANSVVILDEVQTLPPELLATTLDVLQTLISDFGCTIVFCTATQPNFSRLNVPLIAESREIVSAPEANFRTLQRVEFAYRSQPLTHEDLASELAESEQVLCVLNTRRDAVRMVKALDGHEPFHLSTYLVPSHRRKVLKAVRQRLSRDEPCLLISTQVVEAGVNVDFPAVYRHLGPLDRIVQAAGRCNREGKRSIGVCTIFKLTGAHQPQGTYAVGSGLTETLLKERGTTLAEPASFDEYFMDLYRIVGLDPHKIQHLRSRLQYREVAKKYRFIPDETSVVLVESVIKGEDSELLKALDAGVELKMLSRELQQYSVSLRTGELEKYRKQGLITAHPSGAFLWIGEYDEVLGIGGGMTYEPDSLVY